MKAKIAEIFKSIQGEGIYQGSEQSFVRFFGCNLNCAFCDTKLNFYQELSVAEALEKIFSYKECNTVSLTGGEPLLQIDFLKDLVKNLKDAGKITYLETNGTLYQNLKEIIDNIDIVAMDFKLPSSTLSEKRWQAHREFLKVAKGKDVFIKAVIGKATRSEDLLEAINIIKELEPDLPRPYKGRGLLFVLQPQNPFEDLLETKLKRFKEICQNQNLNAQVIGQLHKQLGVK